MNGWLSDAELAWAQRNVPIVCVDLLPVTYTGGRISHVGLIRRDTPSGTGWCLIGGRVRHGESLAAAADRHLHETLGTDARMDPIRSSAPDAVAEYFMDSRAGFPTDPRQHAVAMTYVVTLAGNLIASGEAHEFGWFPVDAMPTPMGFDQGRVLALIPRLDTSSK